MKKGFRTADFAGISGEELLKAYFEQPLVIKKKKNRGLEKRAFLFHDIIKKISGKYGFCMAEAGSGKSPSRL